MDFSFVNSTKLFFTNTVEKDIYDFFVKKSYRKVVIITGCCHSKNIAINLVSKINNIDYMILDGVVSNPILGTINSFVSKIRSFSPDVIVSVGGGSVHDTGKAVSILYYSDTDNLEDYCVDGCYSVPGIKKVLPLITIPTLFGSGAEVSPAALIRIENQKKVIFSPLLYPEATFINVDFLLSTDRYVLARSAFDSFIQAFEGYISSCANSLSDAFSFLTIQNFISCFDSITNNGILSKHDLEKLAIASIFSSYVCSTSSVGAIHAISDPLSGRFDMHHAEALALVCKEVLRFNLSAVSVDRVNKLNSLLSFFKTEKSDPSEQLIDRVSQIIDGLSLCNYSRLPLLNDDLLQLMAKESINPDMSGNPFDFSFNEIVEVLRKSLCLKN